MTSSYPQSTCIPFTTQGFQHFIKSITEDIIEIQYDNDTIILITNDNSKHTDAHQYLKEITSDYFQLSIAYIQIDHINNLVWLITKPFKNKIVKSIEEEIGVEYWSVQYPNEMSEAQIDNIIQMASRYASSQEYYDWNDPSDCEEAIANYDTYAQDILQIKENTNGQTAFETYLSYHNCTVAPYVIQENYTYKW